MRVVVGGAPALAHVPMAERRLIFLREHDWVRRALMFEPRGHDVMSGAILYPSAREDCDIAVLFIEVSGCLPMCGHGAIGVVTAAVSAGYLRPDPDGRCAIETPAGRVAVRVRQAGERVEQVALTNVASYLHARDVALDVEGLGAVSVDVAFGGNYYVIVEPQATWPGLAQMRAGDLVRLSPAIRAAAQAKIAPVHPTDPRISGVSHVMWCDAPRNQLANARNAVFYGEKAIDRSPCGTGSSARMAQLVARGQLALGEAFVHESIIGSLFHCRPLEAAKIGALDAIIPEVAGSAEIIGHNTIFVDDRDPLAHGFQLD